MKIYKPLSIALTLTATVCSSAVAQSYYDDDIYYDASKDVKPKTSSNTGKQTRQQHSSQYAAHQYQYVTTTDGTVYVVDELGNAYPVQAQNIPGSDLYSVYTDNTRDVDEYNRRYQVVDTVNVDSLSRDPFANTRLIEKFSNPDVVSASDDQALINYYASTQPAQINIYMDTPAYYGWNYLSPYYRPYGYWNSWAWDPWYYGTGWYDPYWSWSWSWGWSGPGWAWGYPGWGPYPGHHHGWGYPGWAWGRPQSSPGAFRPHRPGGAAGNNIANTGGYRGNYRGGNSSYTPGTRPSTSNGGYRGNNGRRPGSTGTVNNLGTTRPAPNYNGGSSGGYRYNAPTNNGGRTGGRSNSYNNNNSSRQSAPSYRSSGSSGGSRGSFSGGSRGGGSRSGGGGGRGGRH